MNKTIVLALGIGLLIETFVETISVIVPKRIGRMLLAWVLIGFALYVL